jgi:transmembrane sensor
MTRLSSREVDRQAAEWVVRKDAGPLSPEDQAVLDAWLECDARHFGAYAKARAVFVHADRGKAFGSEYSPEQPGPGETTAHTSARLPSRRHIVLGGGIAAGFLAAAASPVILRLMAARSFSTRVGETQVIALEDGSIVTLNTNSRIDVHFSKERRDISLVRGEALFDVAKNKERPFIVEANGTTVRAVGTSFSVAALPGGPVQVLVREGEVEVKRAAVPVAPPVRLKAYNRAIAPADAPIETAAVAPSEITRALSWRMGRVSFEGESLQAAAETFSRYSHIRIEIDDPEVAKQTVTGLFVSNDPVGFSKAVAMSLGLRAEVHNDSVKLSR